MKFTSEWEKMFFLLSFQVADSRWEFTSGADSRWEFTSGADSRWNPHLNWKMKFDPKKKDTNNFDLNLGANSKFSKTISKITQEKTKEVWHLSLHLQQKLCETAKSQT